MCAADPTGISHSFGIDSLQPHFITYTELDQSLTGYLHRIVRKKFVVSCMCAAVPTGIS
jgi:hypothetical protein